MSYLFLAFLLSASVHLGSGEDIGWTAFGGSNDHSGYRDEVLGSVRQLRLKWAAKASLGTSFENAVIFNGLVISLLTPENTLYSISEATGDIVCLSPLKRDYTYSWPSIGVDGMVLLQGQGQRDSGSTWGTFIMSINPKTCQVNWEDVPFPYLRTLGKFPYGPVSSNLVGFIYGSAGLLNNEIFAVSPAAGKMAYNTPLYNAKWTSPDTWGLTIVSPADNRLLFSAGLSIGPVAERSPPMVGEINPTNGNVLWRVSLNLTKENFDSSVCWVPVVSSRNGIALAALPKAVSSIALAGVELNGDHNIKWVTEAFDWRFRSDATPAVDGDLAYLTAMDAVRGYNIQTGHLEALYGPCHTCSGQPIVTNDFLFVKSRDGVLAFNKEHGTPIAQTDEEADYFSYHARTLFVSRKFAGTLKAYDIEA